MSGDAPDPYARSRAAAARLAELVPGGAHTYAKGPDQYPADIAPIIARGAGAHVWDLDGHEYIEYGSGLRSVILGHAHPLVVDAVRRQVGLGANFTRPAGIEADAAERFLTSVPGAEMVKFAKNGSDVTTAAVRLARAHTGRDLVAICADHPFFSVDDWFIGATAMPAGIPSAVRELTVTFPYGDLDATRRLLQEHGERIACLVLEAGEPAPGYLSALRDLAHAHGALLIFDEMITGLRWHAGGAQTLFGVTPDLSAFGKAIGNGFAVSALAGRRDLMQRGGLDHDAERVFLLSTTHGAETHALAAMIAVLDVFEREDVVARLHATGAELAEGVRAAADAAGVSDHLVVRGRDSNLVFATLDGDGRPSQEYRTLFMRQLLLGGVLAPSLVVSDATSAADVRRTVEVVADAAVVYRKALEAGDPTPWMGGRSIRPVFRTYA
ncbi:glutamate-1-semialdehyde 2,1-aminomutase [Luteipulveratus flavus]|uniref:Glutamate-1-semialdehyde 2,1-aminomutase n=1 Tax=Luteipulveratus flavus TaxID=3031728 RepID=A0ABT6CDY0_9MICO|nr:glutamate-1-semialdehyde 2,1-aminomutase [Luteipulveratus sp. YIM 133296]MDF8266487.1 glutamate-1-semialdehyde 2,1-aminomutase [Luteipulveratus sp. YIM 133296]